MRLKKKKYISQLSYIAQISQVGQTITANPLVNTLNAGSWVYNGTGHYYSLIQMEFDVNKIHISGITDCSLLPITNGSYIVGYIMFYACEWDLGLTSLEIKCFDIDHNATELAALIGNQKYYLPEVKYFT